MKVGHEIEKKVSHFKKAVSHFKKSVFTFQKSGLTFHIDARNEFNIWPLAASKLKNFPLCCPKSLQTYKTYVFGVVIIDKSDLRVGELSPLSGVKTQKFPTLADSASAVLLVQKITEISLNCVTCLTLSSWVLYN